MEKFFLEIPSINKKADIIDYLNELEKYKSDTNGCGMLEKIIDGYTFEDALESCLQCQYEDYAKSIGRLQSKTFLLIREKDNKLIGTINIRLNLDEKKHIFRGYIGYGIRPTERRKGYSKINLYLGLIEAKKIGLNKIFIVCEFNNIASNKTLKALGGKLKLSKIDPDDGILTNVYWFDINYSLKKYKEIYYQNISKKYKTNL